MIECRLEEGYKVLILRVLLRDPGLVAWVYGSL